jgi:hypothetical protein
MSSRRAARSPFALVAALLLLAATLPFVAVYGFLSFASSDPSTATLEADIAAVTAQIAETDAEAAKYSGGAVLNLLQMQKQMLVTSKDMLEQKRLSVLRRINLNYNASGTPQVPDDSQMKRIQADIDSQLQEAEAGDAEAAQYSGGLVQSLAMMKAATARLSAAQLRMAYYFAKYGVPWPTTEGSASPKASQNIVSDGDAL